MVAKSESISVLYIYINFFFKVIAGGKKQFTTSLTFVWKSAYRSAYSYITNNTSSPTLTLPNLKLKVITLQQAYHSTVIFGHSE